MAYRDPELRRAYGRQWMRKRRAAFFEGKACVKCGATERLELDHIDPSQKTSHSIWSWSQKRREAEIAKCQVLCASCHLAKTKRDLRKMRRGTGNPLALLDDDKVSEARRMHRAGVPLDRIAPRYGVGLSTIRYAVRGKTWKHVDEPPVKTGPVRSGVSRD